MATFAPPSHRVPFHVPAVRVSEAGKLGPKPAFVSVLLHGVATATLAALAAAPVGLVLAATLRPVMLP